MKKRFRIFLPVLFFSVLVLSCKKDEVVSGFEWETASLRDMHISQNLVEQGFQQAASRWFINSIIIIRHGKIGAERYFNSKNANSYQTIRSVSKSFLSALVGIAISKGSIKLEQKAADFFPEYFSDIKDSRVKNITVEHLLKMKSGIKGDESFYFTFTGSNNWVKTIVESQLEFEPGTKRQYSTAGTHLLGAVLAKAVDANLMDYGKANLFDPMGINIKNWFKDPQGNYFGGNDMYFTTRDMAALGLLYMNKGMVKGHQIVPGDWTVNSVKNLSGATYSSWGKLTDYGYGYLWWNGTLAEKEIYFALGHGGQFVVCVPSLDLIIAANSYPDSDWSQADSQERAVLDIIAEYFIPAAY
jgi:CubicO group peptidase (beta-lactamase class C family)